MLVYFIPSTMLLFVDIVTFTFISVSVPVSLFSTLLYQLTSPFGFTGSTVISGAVSDGSSLSTSTHAFLIFPFSATALTLYHPVPYCFTLKFISSVRFLVFVSLSITLSWYINSTFAIFPGASISAFAFIVVINCSYLAVIFGALFKYLSIALSSSSSSLSTFPKYSILIIPFSPS